MSKPQTGEIPDGALSKSVPTGYLGNLNTTQEKALRALWDKFLNLTDEEADAIVGTASKDKTKHFGRTELHNTFWQASTREVPDATMLRFLRARGFDLQKSFTMMTNALKWRIEFGIDDILSKGEIELVKPEVCKGFVFQFDVGKSYLHGADKLERPVIYIHVKKHLPKDQPAASLEKFTIYCIETGRLFLQAPRQQCCLLFDMTDFGLKNMDWGFILFLVKSFEAYYPESLGVVLVHNAPWVFWGIWKVLSPMLDPVVRQKIAFTRNAKELLEFIDAGKLPKEMGGQEEWTWKYTPPTELATTKTKDTKTKEELLEKLNGLRTKFDEATKEWAKSGSEESAKERGHLQREIRLTSIEIDPYLYPRSVYYEQGILKDDATIEWDYKSSDGRQKIGVSIDELKKELA